ncbi:hypothetical protein DESUT3_17050 [Desulfuromonas versatilis]|uniref:DUF5667 domain-containing protein n=1 Tax=Desulfuromonas versatilis TaxID=2802975 RepID=A0ABN6DWY1_9BACT|nr:hypothetical protein [Desulfuromonas versatilis]BCR04636.1 hypothetical protein DESUT3_17050 [Desulfuromonas versatilis]
MNRRPNAFLTAAVLLALSLPAPPPAAHADYQILLKRGTRFVVPDYEIDKQSVSFWMDGGKVNVPRDKVLYISKIRGEAGEVTAVVKTIGFGRDSEYATEEFKSDLRGGDGERDKEFQEQAQRLETRYRSAMSEFQSAAQEEDPAKREEAVKAILEIKREKANLAEQAKQLHGGELPSWWEASAQ